jgi:hypothetical protein
VATAEPQDQEDTRLALWSFVIRCDGSARTAAHSHMQVVCLDASDARDSSAGPPGSGTTGSHCRLAGKATVEPAFCAELPSSLVGTRPTGDIKITVPHTSCTQEFRNSW